MQHRAPRVTWPRFRNGFLLIAFDNDVTPARYHEILAAERAVEIKTLGVHAHLVYVGAGRVLDSLERLKKYSEVLYVEPDFIQALTGGTPPNDTYAGIQWAISNTGQTINGFPGLPGADERSALAWGVTTGSSAVAVAVLDTGVQYSHPDLASNIWTNPGGIGGCAAGTHGYNVLAGNCDPMDDDTSYGGHGTHVAGIIGAVGNNQLGVAGVNWTTSIIPVKWVDAYDTGYTSDLISAMDWVIAAKQAGVNIRVVNDSATWPGTVPSQAVSDEIDLLGSNDILLVTASGNTAENNDVTPRYPCSYNRPNMICVGASDQNDQFWSSSNYGITTVKLAAPGVNIFSTLRQSNYGYISGGSMAAPQVAGTAALLLSTGYLPVADVRADILNSVDALSSLQGWVATGGRLNVCNAIPGCLSGATDIPSNSQAPIIGGSAEYGYLLSASTGVWSGMPTRYTYQWYRCPGPICSPIPGATAPVYALLDTGDIGSTVQVTVTASNTTASTSATSAATVPISSSTSPFQISSNISAGATITGTMSWQVSPATAVNFVQFFIDGTLAQTISSTPYMFNAATTGLLDSSTLSNGTHVLGVRALASDNRTYGFYGATVTVSNAANNTAGSETTSTLTSGGNTGIALVQSAAVAGNGVASLNISFPLNNSAGNLIIAVVRLSSTSQTATITDTTGNTYIDAVAQIQSADGHQLHLLVAKNIKGGPNTVTAALSSTNNHPWLAVYEYRGLDATNPLDQTSHGQGGSASTDSGWTLPTAAPNELVFAATGLPSSYTGMVTPGSGYTIQQQNTTTSRAATEAAVAGATGTFNAQFNLNPATNWSAVVATFKGSNQPTSLNGSGTGTTSSPITLVQSTALSGTGVNSLSVPFQSNNVAGDLIIAFVRMSSTTETVNIVDTAGNAYSDAISQAQSADGHQIHVFYAKNIHGGNNAVRATFSSTNNHPFVAIAEYSGLNMSSPLDRTASAQGSGGTADSGSTLPTASPSELVIVATGLPSSYTGAAAAGASYAILQQDTGTSRAAMETVISTSTGSLDGVFNLTPGTNWSAVIATFKP